MPSGEESRAEARQRSSEERDNISGQKAVLFITPPAYRCGDVSSIMPGGVDAN